MTDLFSVLLVTFTINGVVHEREPLVPHATCMAAAEAIMRANPEDRPKWQMLDGSLRRVESATCITGCVPDAMAKNWDLTLPLHTALRESDETKG